MSDEATEKHQSRLQTACDSWLVSSVRRLNEHGQNVIESLMRSTDQALRDSCSKVFEGLAETIMSAAGRIWTISQEEAEKAFSQRLTATSQHAESALAERDEAGARAAAGAAAST